MIHPSWRNLAFAQYIPRSEVSLALLLIGLTLLATCCIHHHRSTGNKAPGFANNLVGLGRGGPGQKLIAKDRGLGEWTPAKFEYPSFGPRMEPLTEIAPLVHRPFRGGEYNATMGIRSMPWEDWIQLDWDYERYHRIRKRRVDTRGEKVIRILGDAHNPGVVKGGRLAAIELVHELAEYLSRRYPTTFRVTSRHELGRMQRSSPGEHGFGTLLSPTREEDTGAEPGLDARGGTLPEEIFCDWGWEGAPPIKAIHVALTGETHELPLHVRDGERAPERAMEIASLLVSDDLALMIEGADGRYYFQAGAILVPGTWRLEDKIGLALDEIHTSGDVPFYREKLETSMARYFRRLAVDKPVMRSNYFLQVMPKERTDEIDPGELAWGTYQHGDEDELGHQEAPRLDHVDVSRVVVRTERQTLRRLGRSGAIVFAIRTYCEPVTGLGEDVRRLGSGMAGWPAVVRRYKGADRGGLYSCVMEYVNKYK